MSAPPSVQQFLALIGKVFDASSVTLFQVADTEAYRLASAFSTDPDRLSSSPLPQKRGLAGWILRHRQPLLVPHFDASQSRLGYYRDDDEAHIKSFMGCPLQEGGALCVDSTRHYGFSEEDHSLLQLFARQLTAQKLAWEQQERDGDIPRYFAQMERICDLRFHTRRWSDLLQHFLRSVTEASGASYCAVAVAGDEGSYSIEGESTPLLLSARQAYTLETRQGLVGWVFRNGQPVFSEQGGEAATQLFGPLPDCPDFQTIACLPIIIQRGTQGVLCLSWYEQRIVPAPLRSFLQQAASQLGLYLENLLLKERLRRLLPTASVHRHGAVPCDPDTAPVPPRQDDEA